MPGRFSAPSLYRHASDYPIRSSQLCEYADGMDKVTRTEAQWREQLTPEEYQVLRQAGTERPFAGEYTDTKARGRLPLPGVRGGAVPV